MSGIPFCIDQVLATHNPLKVKVTDDQMRSVNIQPHEFHGEWNYTVRPRNQKPKP
jgi:hypothetical protein